MKCVGVYFLLLKEISAKFDENRYCRGCGIPPHFTASKAAFLQSHKKAIFTRWKITEVSGQYLYNKAFSASND